MGYVVIKYTVMQDQGQGNTDQKKVERGPVCVTDSAGKTWCWGPNESKTIPSPYAEEILAAENRLTEISRS